MYDVIQVDALMSCFDIPSNPNRWICFNVFVHVPSIKSPASHVHILRVSFLLRLTLHTDLMLIAFNS
jgi:hypothetical protein